ncbi:MAG: gamma carbonic anhydrase family protein [Chloroflexota bacterium]
MKERMSLKDIMKQAVAYMAQLDAWIAGAKRNGCRQDIADTAFIAEGARILGDVTIGENSSVWFNAVVRGDEGPIIIGKNSNVQDCCVLHSDVGSSLLIGDWATIGHSSVVRGAQIGDYATIGMHSTIMTGAVIPEYCVVGAHSFVPYGKEFPPRSLILGAPAEAVRQLDAEELKNPELACRIYMKLMEYYKTL